MLFNSFIQRRFTWLATDAIAASVESSRAIDNFKRDFEFRHVTHYDQRWTLLSELCDRHGSDKGQLRSDEQPYDWPAHTYTEHYNTLYDHCREHVANVFECGLGTNNTEFRSNMGIHGRPGASLRVWRDYFPQASIVGADIDAGVLFTEPRILTFQVDQTDPESIASLWRKVEVECFDLMIDDGLHEFDAGSCLFMHSIHKLSSNGIYVIEDVKATDLASYRKFFVSRPYMVDYVNLHRPDMEVENNSMIIIRHALRADQKNLE
ncbi:class I SAM-dependent methyltransferase [Wenzhouxiangella sp. AB-CW3]|uniref:class I SAM-dependent methyltransferase n=1 Tax=Wenzhouxiangella sp. AB-CW3 TaxID=2771012 RepID=UPI00168BE05E|nr:class I SAM-dependent methyltransferase [Wenzhouxiangella sp. AB-CW3]QOC22020.1 class I SAM-dependent methyltransferase [Wenzhouxiangella sp. AB-CW3]